VAYRLSNLSSGKRTQHLESHKSVTDIRGEPLENPFRISAEIQALIDKEKQQIPLPLRVPEPPPAPVPERVEIVRPDPPIDSQNPLKPMTEAQKALVSGYVRHLRWCKRHNVQSRKFIPEKIRKLIKDYRLV
jgi:hypothetical protein